MLAVPASGWWSYGSHQSLRASDSPACLTYSAAPRPPAQVLTTAGTWPAPEHPAVCPSSLQTSGSAACLLSQLQVLGEPVPSLGHALNCPHRHIWAPHAKLCQSTNSYTAASLNLRCPFESLHFPFLSPGAPLAPSYLSHPALSPLSYKPCRVYITSPSRLSSSEAEDELYSSYVSRVQARMGPKYVGEEWGWGGYSQISS